PAAGPPSRPGAPGRDLALAPAAGRRQRLRDRRAAARPARRRGGGAERRRAVRPRHLHGRRTHRRLLRRLRRGGGGAGQASRRAPGARFSTLPRIGDRPTHELLVTHAFQVAWLVREALGAPPASWMSLGQIENTALTTIVHSFGEP